VHGSAGQLLGAIKQTKNQESVASMSQVADALAVQAEKKLFYFLG